MATGKLFAFLPQSLLFSKCNLINQVRTVIILKRRYPTRLHKKNEPPKKLRTKDYIYDLVLDTQSVKKDSVNVILTSYVEGMGRPGEQISVRPFGGYYDYILPGLAVYATPENLIKYSSMIDMSSTYSSKYSYKTVQLLQNLVLSLEMNQVHPWTIEPWHIRVALRKAGFFVPESTIELPKNRLITGPLPEQQNKEFYATVIINNHEKVKVRCRIHLWCLAEEDRPAKLENWEKAEPLFEEDRPILDGLPLPAKPLPKWEIQNKR